MSEIFLFRDQHGIRLGEPPLCFVDFLFQRGGVYRTFIDIEQSYVVERYLMEKDDELDQVRIRLLPEGLFTPPEEVVEQRCDVVRQSVCVEVVVKRVVAIFRIET